LSEFLFRMFSPVFICVGLPGVLFVLPDSYVDPENKDYGGEDSMLFVFCLFNYLSKLFLLLISVCMFISLFQNVKIEPLLLFLFSLC